MGYLIIIESLRVWERKMSQYASKKLQNRKNNSSKSNGNNSRSDYAQGQDVDLIQRTIESSGQELTPDVVMSLQRTHGNQLVQQLIQRQTDHSTTKLVIQRFPDKDTWVKDSTMSGLFSEYDRSDALVAIDNAIDEYNKVKTSEDFKLRKLKIGEIDVAIRLWRASKGKVKGKKDPAKSAKRWKYIETLIAQVNKEKDKVQTEQIEANKKRKEEARVAKNKALPEIVTSHIQTIEDPAARAVAVFKSYMAYFRGTATYTLKTQPGMTIFNAGGTIACATIAQGLVDSMRYADLEAKTIQIPELNFITNQIDTGKFMDSSAVGNVANANDSENFAAVKRFFFSKHWIVEVTDAGVYFDPTSGVQVSSNAASEIIDSSLTGFEDVGKQTYAQGDNYRLAYQGDIAPSGGAYALTKIEE